MSRLERKKNERCFKQKYKTICRVIFLFIMLIITSSSILLIDYRINELLDDDSKNSIREYIIDNF